jgi:hypothetical protein
MVVFVCDDDPVLAVAADAGGAVELTVLLAPDAELVVENALRSEHFDSVVRPDKQTNVTRIAIGLNWFWNQIE